MSYYAVHLDNNSSSPKQLSHARFKCPYEYTMSINNMFVIYK